MTYKITVDTGGTFTDVVLADHKELIGIYKAPTTPDDIFEGVSAAVTLAAVDLDMSLENLLQETEVFVYATTRSTNAILEKKTAKTAFLTTAGHQDILLYREGGKPEPFNFRIPYPEPYIARHLTFEVRERILSDGEVDTPLDEDDLVRTFGRLKDLEIEAVGVCLLWSFINPVHEEQIGKLLEQHLPGVEYTLSHLVNPIIREYRRASSTVIDASIKPLMRKHLLDIDRNLRTAGFAGEPLMVTHVSGGVLHFTEISEKPVHTVDSGPAMAPIAGLTYAKDEQGEGNVIVIDTGGTSFDVSLIRQGAISHTREKWMGQQFLGHMTGMSAVDSRSIGAGGGSIAWVDAGGLLHVGPESAGAIPGPVCYGRGGDRPTVTDAALILGYIDPAYFLGGRMPLDIDGARSAIEREVGKPLSFDVERSATAIMQVASEVMRSHIWEMTVDQGLDPRECLMVGGGGACGLNAVSIAREMGVDQVLMPRLAAALSAVGGQYSDLTADFTAGYYTTSGRFEYDGVNGVLDRIGQQMDEFFERVAREGEQRREFICEARYAHQVWELEVPFRSSRFAGPADVEVLTNAFHDVHERVFAVREAGQQIECINWRGRASQILPKPAFPQHVVSRPELSGEADYREREAIFDNKSVVVKCYRGETLAAGAVVEGPAIIEEPTTTIVLIPDSRATVTERGNYLIDAIAS